MAEGTPSRLTRPRALVVVVLGVLGLVLSAHLVSCPNHTHLVGSDPGDATHTHLALAEAHETDGQGLDLEHVADCVDDTGHDLFGAVRIQQALTGASTIGLSADELAPAYADPGRGRPRPVDPLLEPGRRHLFGVRLLTAFCVFRI
ncbi:MAG: hypothetical protein GEV07_14355 [Streptosporangiales bacterium]|nr:hypothetical protein [Streptosporangiales bacterium]